MNSSSLSKANLALAALAAVVAASALTRLFGMPPLAWQPGLELLVTGALLGFAFWSLHRTAYNLRAASAVCVQASRGELEARILGSRDGGDLGRLQKGINDMLDIVDAYVRESSA